jgi:hypothetical protein
MEKVDLVAVCYEWQFIFESRRKELKEKTIQGWV